jgi:hypothetical protein
MASSPPDAPAKRTLPVRSGPNYVYAQADTVSITTALTGGIEISFLALQMELQSQEFDVESRDSQVESLTSPQPKSAPAIINLATIRLTVPAGIETAATIFRHLIKNGETKENIAGILRANGIIDWDDGHPRGSRLNERHIRLDYCRFLHSKFTDQDSDECA